MKFKSEKNLQLPRIDREILDLWEKNNVFLKSIEARDAEDSYVFYEGPPSANGKPGIHHVMARTVKDIFCRYQTLKGKRVLRKGGWDTHGLPIEISVEKELGITKEDIGSKISVEEYNQKCRETVLRYKDMWDSLTRKMGYWVDLENPYITFKNEYIESVWWLLAQLYEKGFMYKGYTIQPYSPAAGTGLSTHELNQPGTYKMVMDTTVVAQFQLVHNADAQKYYALVDEGEIYFIAWTTTPWTLPSNTALAVGKKITYDLIATFNPYTYEPINVFVAQDLVGKWFTPEQAELKLDDYTAGDKVIPYRVLGSFKGEELAGLKYEQLMPYAQVDGKAFEVLLGDFVSTEDGTGIVHLAPSFGADDKRVADANGIAALTLVDKQGKFTADAGPYAGRYVKDYKDEPNYTSVDIDIAVDLKKANKAFRVQKYEHSYPHCWRTDKPVLYYPLDSWFVKTTAVKDRMIELNKTINWKPAHTGEKRFGNWLENLQDWNLSRSRYWGIPLPIWRTKDASEEMCIASLDDLRNEIGKANEALDLRQEVPSDLHRPFIDEITLVSPSGKPMYRELDLIDVWFDSGSMPYAQWHYPFDNATTFKQNFPADFIAEGVDQTRGWFYTLHAIAVMVFDSVAYKNVISNGLVQDKNGQKMSKRLGNTVEPFEAIEKYGADAVRWYMIANAQPWDNLKFDFKVLEETQRKFFSTLHNTYSFFTLYANIDAFNYSEARIPVEERTEMDRWIISELNTMIRDVDRALTSYEPTLVARRIQEFTDDFLSNWYVRLNRRRFWKGAYEKDKVAAYQTLYECLLAISKLMSPIAPFYADWMFTNLNSISKHETHASVHLSFFPEVDQDAIDADLETRMQMAQKYVTLILSLRKKANLRVRQPLSKIMIPYLDDAFKQQIELVSDIILRETNVKELELLAPDNKVLSKEIKPNFASLGRRLGKHMKAAQALFQTLDQTAIRQIEQEGKWTIDLEGEAYVLTDEDYIISAADIEGWSVASEGQFTVALDTTLTEPLILEGLARELVNRIQNIRKDEDLEVTDRISVHVQNNDKIETAIREHYTYIAEEVLADEIVFADTVQTHVLDLPFDIQTSVRVEKA